VLVTGREAVVEIVVEVEVEEGKAVDDVLLGLELKTFPPINHTPFFCWQHGLPTVASPQHRLPSSHCVI